MGELRPFSSGVLTAFPGLFGSGTLPDATQTLSGAPLTATRAVNSGATYGGADIAANIVDGSLVTVATLNAHTAASPSMSNDWFDVDTGSPYTYTQVVITITAQGAGSNTLNIWAADSPGALPGGLGTVLVATLPAVTGTNTITPTLAIQGRHLLIEVVNAAASSITVSEVTATVYSGIVFAQLQNITATHKSEKKLLYGPAWVNMHPEDVGFFNGAVELQAEVASISSAGLRKLIGSTETSVTVGPVTTLTETQSKVFALPSFAGVLQTQDNAGVSQFWHFPNCRAPGVQMTAKISDFTMSKFAWTAYPDAGGTIAYHQLPTS